MTLDLDSTHATDAYPLLASLITPRPIAWVTTQNHDKQVNLAPFSFFNVMGAKPPIVCFAPGNKDATTPKDTARNILANHEFVIHTVDEPLAQAMADSAKPLDYGLSEIDNLNLSIETAEGNTKPLTLTPSDTISVPRLAQAPVALECRMHSSQRIGHNRLIIGTVHRLHIRDGILNPDTLKLSDNSPYHPIGRMASPNHYCTTKDQFQL